MRDFAEQLTQASQRLMASVARIEELTAQIEVSGHPVPEELREALLFSLERAAWAMIEMANAWVFELRLGIARKETEAFDLLQKNGSLELDTARRLKQLCEYRTLSSREPARIDWHYIGGDLSAEILIFKDWNKRALAFPRGPS
jgi:uncharacterized protein YutE (UPF0331/DUF86 family)